MRSRVENLCFWRPDITVAEVKAAMKEAFSREYGLSLAPLPPPEEDKITPLLSRYESWEWNYGRNIPFTCTLEKRFSWGGAEVCLQVEAGTVREARIYTDAMDIGWVPDMEKALTGCRFEKSALCGAAAGIETAPEIRDVFSEMEE